MSLNKKIIFIQTAYPGDAILTLPALQVLKQSDPDNSIDVLCIPKTKEIFEASPFVDNVMVLDKIDRHKSIFATYKFSNELSKNGYTKLYSAHRSLRTSFMVLNLHVEESFGFDNSSLMHVYKNIVHYNSSKHEVMRNLDLVGFDYDEEGWKIRPIVDVSIESKNLVNDFIHKNELQNGFVAIAPSSIWNTKMYPAEYYSQVIDRLLEKKLKIVLLGSKDETDFLDSFTNHNSNRVINTAGMFSIVQSIELLKHSSILICNDSAPTHMGMAANVSTLTLYCSTIPEFGFYPYYGKSYYLSYNDLKCKPCGIHGYKNCPLKTFDCGIKLTPDLVMEKIEEMLLEGK